MENERFLDLSIAELSADRSRFDEEAGELIDRFKSQRIEAYFNLASHIRALQENQKIGDEQAEEKMSQLIDLSTEEFKEPLLALELEYGLGILEQYKKQTEILEEIGILQDLPESQRPGVIGINGQEYPLPDLIEISLGLTKEKIEIIKQKAKQGFTKLMMVPFPMRLLDILEAHKKLILEKSQQGLVKSEGGEVINPKPGHEYFVSGEYEWHSEDPEKSFIYYFEAIDDRGYYYNPKRNRNSKKELLEEGRGWNIVLAQDFHPMIDQNGLRLDGRLDDKYGTSAEDFLKILKKSPEFRNEVSFAVEDWSMYAMLALAERNLQIDYDDRVCLAIGGYFQQANVGYHTPTCYYQKTGSTEGVNINFTRTDNRDGGNGIRTFVNINF